MEEKNLTQQFLEHSKIVTEIYAKQKENEKHILIKTGFIHPTPNQHKSLIPKTKEITLRDNNPRAHLVPKCNKAISIKFEI